MLTFADRFYAIAFADLAKLNIEKNDAYVLVPSNYLINKNAENMHIFTANIDGSGTFYIEGEAVCKCVEVAITEVEAMIVQDAEKMRMTVAETGRSACGQCVANLYADEDSKKFASKE